MTGYYVGRAHREAAVDLLLQANPKAEITISRDQGAVPPPSCVWCGEPQEFYVRDEAEPT